MTSHTTIEPTVRRESEGWAYPMSNRGLQNTHHKTTNPRVDVTPTSDTLNPRIDVGPRVDAFLISINGRANYYMLHYWQWI